MLRLGVVVSLMSVTHNEPFPARERPVAGNLYVVVRHGRNHNSPAQWAAHRPLPRLGPATPREVRQTSQLPVLLVEQRAERRSEGLPEQLLERLLE